MRLTITRSLQINGGNKAIMRYLSYYYKLIFPFFWLKHFSNLNQDKKDLESSLSSFFPASFCSLISCETLRQIILLWRKTAEVFTKVFLSSKPPNRLIITYLQFYKVLEPRISTEWWNNPGQALTGNIY